MSRPPIHPGEILAEELAASGVKASELARQIKVPPNRISRLVNGQHAVTGDIALRLGHWFGNSAQFWLNLQMAYELRLAEQEVGEAVAALPVRPTTAPPPKQPSLL